MNITPKILELEVGGKAITVETGVLSPLTNGAVLVRSGETAVYVTATMSSEPKDLDFFPLTVDYESKMYSVGRIPGGFLRREGKPPDTSILTCRVIDRQLRPLFPDGFRNDVQIVAQLFSSDQEDQPDVLAMIGASVALSISDIPFAGPTAGVRVGLIDGEWVLNPTYQQIEESDLDLVIAGTETHINMVEAGSYMVSEEQMLQALELGQAEIKKITAKIKEFQAEVGKEKIAYEAYEVNETIFNWVSEQASADVTAAMGIADNAERKAKLKEISKSVKAKIAELDADSELGQLFAERSKDLGNSMYKLEKGAMRKAILETNTRIDGRQPDVIRPLHCEVGMIPRTHGSALFVRGNTQAMSFATLGSMSDAQPLDNAEPMTSKRYMHNYNFPGYSVGEPRPLRGPGRREIGHGNLAERAIIPVLPDEEEFPYAFRVVSEIVSSNGSTSMASACASTLTLMDAGVPIKDMVGGIAMGLIKEGDEYKILTDIQGVEDHLGDMDFKVTGTREGITALQMDIKIAGLTLEIMKEALEQARVARLQILDKMSSVIAEPRAELSPYAPRILTLQINPEKIGAVIGPGGKMIKQIVEETGVKIDIEDSGVVFIVTPDAESAEAAKQWVLRLTEEAEIGKIYEGKVVRLTNFGAFIQVLPGQDGLLHVSKVPGRPRHIEDVFSEGEMVKVRVDEIDSQNRINLALEQEVEVKNSGGGHDRGERHDRGDRGDRGGRSHNRGGGGRGRHDRGDRDRGDRGGNDRGGDRQKVRVRTRTSSRNDRK